MTEKYKQDQLEKLKKQKVKYEPKEIVLDSSIKKVSSEAEYWDKHSEYVKKLNKLSRSVKTALIYPDEYIRKFESYLSEMLAYGLVTIEWTNEQRSIIYKKLNYPSELRNWVIKGLNKGKKKFVKSVGMDKK